MDNSNSNASITVNGRNWTVRGTVIGSNEKPIPELIVEAWDKDLVGQQCLGRGTTNEEGQFEVSFVNTAFNNMGLDPKPDLYFVIFQNGTAVANTLDNVLDNVDESHPPIVLKIPLEG